MGHDAILIPGGGLTSGGQPAPWVQARLEAALAAPGEPLLIALSAGTPHRPRGPLTESAASAAWLLERGVAPRRILTDPWSLDTIGNAYFARVMHCDPRRLEKLLVITSEFHLPRARAVFDWVFGLEGARQLDYAATPNVGLSAEVLAAREAKERAALAGLEATRSTIRTLAALHEFLFTRHSAYTAGARPEASREPWAASY